MPCGFTEHVIYMNGLLGNEYEIICSNHVGSEGNVSYYKTGNGFYIYKLERKRLLCVCYIVLITQYSHAVL